MPDIKQEPREYTDPVCGMTVSEDTASITSEYQGKTYRFCASGCKAAFDKAPDKYTSASPKKKGLWNRYLERLNRATGGKPPCCH